MEPSSALNLFEGCFSLMSATRPSSRWTNAAISGIRSFQLALEISHDLSERRWINLNQKLSLLTLLFISIYVQMKGDLMKVPIPARVHQSALFVFSLIHASLNLYRSCERLKVEVDGCGILEFVIASLRISQAGAALAYLSQDPPRNVRCRTDYSSSEHISVTCKEEYYYKCSFKGAKVIDSFYLNTCFDTSLFEGATLTGQWTSCVFEKCNLNHAVLKGRMFQVTFKNCTMEGADFSGISAEDCRFEGCKGKAKGDEQFSKRWII